MASPRPHADPAQPVAQFGLIPPPLSDGLEREPAEEVTVGAVDRPPTPAEPWEPVVVGQDPGSTSSRTTGSGVGRPLLR